MSLLTVVKTVMDSNGWPAVVNAVSSSQDQNMRQALALSNKALKTLSYKKPWPVLTKDYTFQTSPGVTAYPLPPDFHHLVSPSAVDATTYYQIKGAMTPIQWYRYSFNGGMTWITGFRIDAVHNQLLLTPAPGGTDKLAYMYITNLIAKDANGVPITGYAQDTDTAMVDEELVELGLSWRWRQKKGLDYTAEMAEYNGTLNQRFAQFVATGELPIGGRPSDSMWPLTQPMVPRVFGI